MNKICRVCGEINDKLYAYKHCEHATCKGCAGCDEQEIINNGRDVIKGRCPLCQTINDKIDFFNEVVIFMKKYEDPKLFKEFRFQWQLELIQLFLHNNVITYTFYDKFLKS